MTAKTNTKTRTRKAKFNATSSLTAINGNIALLRKNSNAFRDLLQETLLMICRHAENTGDCTSMARLMNDGLTNWYRRGPICDYIRDFTPIIVTFKGGVASARFEEKDQRKPFNLDGMEATPFWDHKSLNKDNELPVEIDDLDTTVTKLADRLAKMLKEGKVATSAVEHAQRLIDGIKGTVSAARAADRKPKKSEQSETSEDEGAVAAAMAAA